MGVAYGHLDLSPALSYGRRDASGYGCEVHTCLVELLSADVVEDCRSVPKAVFILVRIRLSGIKLDLLNSTCFFFGKLLQTFTYCEIVAPNGVPLFGIELQQVLTKPHILFERSTAIVETHHAAALGLE